jgi:hypothetical protein
LTQNRPEVPPTKLALVFGAFVGALMLAVSGMAVLSTRGFLGPIPLEVVDYEAEQACHHKAGEDDMTEHPA